MLAVTVANVQYCRVCQAVGVGFLVMGVIGYFVKLSMDPPSLFADVGY